MSLLASIVDQLADSQPNERFALVAERVDSTEGAKDVSWSAFRLAVDKAAAWIEFTFGKPEKGFPSLGFISTSFDFRYSIFVIACIKVGYKGFLPSPRNSPEFHAHLLDKLSCDKIATTVSLGDWASSCNVVEFPSLEHWLDSTDVKSYPYFKTWDQAKDDQIIAVHSSGSTGPPKPIVWTNGYIEATKQMLLRKSSGTDLFQSLAHAGDSRLIAMPQFHTAGMLAGPCFTILLNKPMTFLPAKAIANDRTIIQFIEAYEFESAYLPPSTLEDISGDLKQAAVLSKVPRVCFGGGPIANDAARILSKCTKMYNTLGTSEASMYPVVLSQLEDQYAWFQFDILPGFVFEPQDDGLFELVFHRTDEVDWPVFHTFPEINAYHTNDLYEKHPEAPNTWKLIRRKDDVLVLSNGEKVVPMPMEDIIRLAPEVEGVVFAGQGKFTVAAVIELHPELVQGRSEEKLREDLVPYLDKANAIAPGFARLTPNMIIFTSASKPMRRTAKGSIIRKLVLKEYTQEIEDLYEQASKGTAVKLVKGLSEAQTVSALSEVFQELSKKNLRADEDFFQAGMDSMQVLAATRTIKASVQAEASKDARVTPSLIYDNPTINLLAKAVRNLVINGSAVSSDDHVDAMEAMLLKYSEGLSSTVSATHKQGTPQNVVLTGSTGSLGSYMLDLLIKNSSVERIFALNRSENASTRQSSSNSSRGLSTDFSKVTFLAADFGSKNLGLPADSYRSVLDSTDLIIHNAWPVDFNQNISSFEPHIRGIRNFIDLAAASSRNPHITFMSSVGVTSFWDNFYPGEPKPEALLRDGRVAAGQGYGEGKYVGEHLLAAAGSAGVSATICRVGQIAGPVTHGTQGMWNKQEWLPSIIASSKYLRALPDSAGNDVANWVPVDYMARAVVDLGMHDLKKAAEAETAVSGANQKRKGFSGVYNLVNPRGGSYKSLIEPVRKHLPEIEQVVSFEKWVHLLKESAEKGDNDPVANPATKLLDFYEHLVGSGLSDTFETEKARQSSAAMAELDAVKPEWMDLWMQQWNF